VLALAVAVTLAGCGGGPSSPAGQMTEPSDPPAPLPPGWGAFANFQRGFSFGVPPSWSVSEPPATTRVSSGDRGLAIAVAADRSATGRTGDLGSYLTATVHALPGYSGVVAAAPRALGGLRYPAEELDARGRFSATGVDQAIRAIALDRPGLVTYTLLIFRNADVAATRYASDEAELLRTFRALAPD